MTMLDERYRHSDKEPIHFQILKVQRYQALKYYGLQPLVDALIKGYTQPDSGAHIQNKQGGQTEKKKGAREERVCPYCLVLPSPHRYSECNKKKANQARKAEERVEKDVQIARLSITSGKVEVIT
ncbi:hypothetical protein SARC_06814 [Sphaeroforma arctica JP610]|uniref:Uncharacterized protein n=1 Tax=Sphaeroforma arctica JP610 TaxID=667725 RepID=A0A0L0FVG8_9EUKA|nr:hypothetical protein SARC_06814 [Sphaeroforma arctica JP610]KNC80832.1 hypothetical protein SARC_06814 [Sphaeroforma arctica JP610]|eukprot:XP_014154734.1 hypothetical protein SARC_06814 [Sphaeroforma arctica JP610]